MPASGPPSGAVRDGSWAFNGRGGGCKRFFAATSARCVGCRGRLPLGCRGTAAPSSAPTRRS